MSIVRVETKSGEHLNIFVEKMPADMFRCLANLFLKLLEECGFEFSKTQPISKTTAEGKNTVSVIS